MKNAADNGMSTIYIPKKPKLTNKKSNKNLIRSGFVPSRFYDDFIPDDQLIRDGIESIHESRCEVYDERCSAYDVISLIDRIVHDTDGDHLKKAVIDLFIFLFHNADYTIFILKCQ